MTGPRVLLIEDDRDVRRAIAQTLELADYAVTATGSLYEATDHIGPGFAGVVVTDLRMPGKDGFAVLERCRQIDADLPVILLTGEGDVPQAVRAMAAGAYDFLEKPCAPQTLCDCVARAWEKRALVLENRSLNARATLAEASREMAEGPLGTRMDAVERLMLIDALRDNAGHVIRTAEALGLPRKTLYDKLSRHGIEPAAFRRRD